MNNSSLNTRTSRWLLLILTVSTLLRLGAAIYMGNTVTDLPGIWDQITYHTLAQRVLGGYGFSYATDWWPMTRAGQPTAHFSFLYVLYLVGVYAIAGVQPLVARILQALVSGVLLPWLLYRLGRRLAGEPTALAAAAIGSVYVYFFYYAAALMTETFFILAVLGSLEMALDMEEQPTWPRSVYLGLALGTGILLRQTLLLFVPFLLGWLLFKTRKRIRWFQLLIPLLIIALLIAPWTVRNYLAFHRFVLLNTNAGFAFFWSNHPIYGSHYLPLLPKDGPTYRDLIPPELRSLNEAEMDAALFGRGLAFVWEDPGRYLLLCLGRIPAYFMFWPSPESSTISNISRVGSFGFFLPFMLYGLVLSLRRWRRYSLLYLFVVVYTGIHLLSWAYIRYRLPVDAVLVLFAGLAVVDLAARLWGLWQKRAKGDEMTG